MNLHLPHHPATRSRTRWAVTFAALLVAALPLGFASSALAATGQIAGTVTSAPPTSAALEGIEVGIYTTSGIPAGHATTNSAGEYEVANLSAGKYKVEFSSPSGREPAYLTQYYQGRATFAGATQVAVTTGKTTPAINAEMQLAVAPANTEAPTLTGTLVLRAINLVVVFAGNTLSCSSGSWTGSPAPTFTYRWLSGGTAIAGASESTYQVQPADNGHNLSCEVIATNVAGSRSASSAPVPAVNLDEGGGNGGSKPGSGTGEQGSGSGEQGSGGGEQGSGVLTGLSAKNGNQIKVSYSITTRSGGVFVRLACLSATGGCPSVTVQLRIVVVEHLRHGRIIALTATNRKTKAATTTTRTVVIASSTIGLVGGSKTVAIPLNATGRRLMSQRKAFAAQVQLTSGGHTVATENIQIRRTASPTRKASRAKTKKTHSGT